MKPDQAAAIPPSLSQSFSLPLFGRDDPPAQQPWTDTRLDQSPLFGNTVVPQPAQVFANSLSATALPAFIKPFPLSIKPSHLSFLESEKALDLPNPTLESELLRCYLEFVHPYMPLLEVHDMLRSIRNKDGSGGQISLLLYQSIMFSATAFADKKLLTAAGYETRRSARRAFFEKAQVSKIRSTKDKKLTKH